MAIMMIMRWEGATPAEYEAVRREVRFESEPPRGGRLHIASHDGKALRICDVWDSAEDLNAFVEGRLMPGVARVGIQTQPQVEVYPLINEFAPAYTAR